MRKFLIGLGAIFALSVVAVFVGPGLIDWNKYKGQITQQVEDLTGRDLTINGNISVEVLPAPALVAKDIVFANDPRAADPDMVKLGSVEVRVALGPLFAGEIQVSKVVLVDPVISLETFADGTNNWTFDTGSASDTGNTTAANESSATGDGGARDGKSGGFGGVTLDNFAVDNGELTFRDGATGAVHNVKDINATLVAASLRGPFEARGKLVAEGIPLGFEAGVDGIFQDRTVPVNVIVTAAGDSSLRVAGNIINLNTEPRFNGSIQFGAKSVAALADVLGQVVPPALARPASLTAKVVGDASKISVTDLKAALDGIDIAGEIEATLGDVPRADVKLRVAHVDADALLASLAAKPAAGQAQAKDQSQQQASDSGTSSASADRQKTSASKGPFKIPGGISASLNLVADSIAYRQEKVGPVRLNAELTNGEITISQFSGQLPGAADFALFGFVNAKGGEPYLEGQTEITVGDTRRLANWLGVDLSAIPGDRMRRLSAKASLKGNSENLQIAGIQVGFDHTTLKGGVTLALRNRLSFGAAIDIDRLDLDPYLAGLVAGGTNAAANAQGASGQEAAGQSTAASNAGSKPENPLAALAALADFDANLKINAGKLVYGGQSIRNVKFDGTIYNGNVTIRNASVENAAGATAAIKGGIRNVAGLPKLDQLNVSFAAGNVGKLAAMAGVDLPISSQAIGAVKLNATADGSVLAPSFKGKLEAAGGQVGFDGDVSVLPIKPLYTGTLMLRHDHLADLLKALDTGYTPSGKIGGVALSMSASVSPKAIMLQGVTGTLNRTRLDGDATVRLGGARPAIQSTLALGDLDLDPFMPADGNSSGSAKAETSSTGTAKKASNDNRTGYAHGKAPWPTDPIDVSGLGAVDATIDLTAKKIAYGAVALENAVVHAKLADRKLTLEQLGGRAFGGDVGVSGMLDGSGAPAANARISFKNGDISRLMTAAIGKPAALGSVSLQSTFDTHGKSVADMVAALNGNGDFTMRGVDVKDSTKGSAMTGILGLLRGFGQLGSSLSGQKLSGLADVDGKFTVKNGVADLKPLKLSSGLGAGVAEGKVDLANWTVNLAGNVDITGNLLTAIIGAKVGTPGRLPFSITGPLDAPDIKMDTSGFSAGGSVIPIPGLDKLEKKVPGLGSLLQGVLGGGETSTQPQSGTGATSSEQPAKQQDNAIKPQDLLKNLFKLGN